MVVGAVGAEDEAAARVWEGLARDACRGFPLVQHTVYKSKPTHILVTKPHGLFRSPRHHQETGMTNS